MEGGGGEAFAWSGEAVSAGVRVESYIIWAVPALVKLRWYYVEYTYEGKQ